MGIYALFFRTLHVSKVPTTTSLNFWEIGGLLWEWRFRSRAGHGTLRPEPSAYEGGVSAGFYVGAFADGHLQLTRIYGVLS